jgi:hypothetical protein
MATQHFKLADGNINRFVDFAEGDPYYLDFSEGGQARTISWETYTVPFEPAEDGFTYKTPNDDSIITQVEVTVKAYNHNRL